METCEIGIQVDLIKNQNSNSTSSSSENTQFKLNHPSSGECSVRRKEKLKSCNKKVATNAENDAESTPLDGGKNLHHMADLGKSLDIHFLNH